MKKVRIYWIAKGKSIRERICKKFGIYGTSVNGESEVFVENEEEYDLLKETARRGFIEIRKTNKDDK